MFMPPLLTLFFLVTAWLPFLFCDESLEEMEKKAAVDCKTIKKTNTRTMNFTEKGKEYVCKQLIEKEHKLYTFFKVPGEEDDSDNPLSNDVCLKNNPEIKSEGKRCFVVCMDPNLDDVRKNMSSLHNGSTKRVPPEKLEAFEIQQNITHKSSDKMFKNNPGQIRTMLARKSVRGRITTVKPVAPFKLSFPAWLKIPSSPDSEGSEDNVSDLNDFESFTELFPSDVNAHIEKRIAHKHKPNMKSSGKVSVLSVTTQELKFPLKNIGTIPTKIEVSTALAVPLVDSYYTEGALNKISLSYDESEPDSFHRINPDLVEHQTSAIKNHDGEYDVNPDTTLVYSDTLAKLISNTELNQKRKENL